MGSQRVVQWAVGRIDGVPSRCQQRELVGEAEADPTVATADRTGSGPDDLTRGAQLVEHRRGEVPHSPRQHVALDRRGDHRCTGELSDRLDQPVETASGPAPTVPSRQETGKGIRFDRLDLAPQHRQRPSPELAQHVDVAPLALHTTRPELATHHPLVGGQRRDRPLDSFDRGREPTGDVDGEERAVGAGEATDERLERVRHRIGERDRQPDRDRTPERVAVARRVLGRRVAHVVADADLDDAPLTHQLVDPTAAVTPLATGVDLRDGEVAHTAEHVVQLVGGPGAATVGKVLQFEFDVGKHARVEQLAQLLGTEQLPQQVTVERERGGATLGERSVAFVHVLGDPVEQQARRERARRAGVDLHEPDLARLELAEHLLQRRHVEDVLQALARRLQQDRERRVLRCHREQIGGPLTLLPQGGPLVGSATRQQQRATGTLAEAGREQRRLRQRRHHQFVDLVGVDPEHVGVDVIGRLGQADDDPVVTPHRLHRQIELVDEASFDRHRPRRVHGGAERAEHTDPPVADLVAEPLDDDRPVVGHHTGRGRLLREVRHHVLGGERIERVVGLEPFERVAVGEFADVAEEATERPTQFERPPRAIAVPERHLARLTGRRGDGDPLERDVLDPPRGRAEHERLAGPTLVHHLLVELADPSTVGKEHAVQAAVGDRAAAGDRQPLRAVAGPQDVVHTVPHEPGPQLGELLARVPTGQQVEHVVEEVVGDLVEVRAPPDEAGDVVDAHLGAGGGMSDDLLGEDVERVAQVAGVLDLTVEHPTGDDRRLDQVATVLREDRPLTRFADLVARATDPLEAAVHRTRRLDLDDQVDRAHVDTELERRRRDDRSQLATLELVFDHDALLARQRAVVRLHQLLCLFTVRLLVQLVELGGEPLGATAGVAEDDRRTVLEHQVEHPRVDAGPDARPALATTRLAERRRRVARCAHVVDRHDHLDLEGLADAGIDDADRTGRPVVVVAAEEAGDLLEWALGGRQADALRRPVGDLVEPFETQRQVGAALGGRHGVDLVDDDGLDAAQGVGGRRGQHQVQRLGRGDEQVGRAADQLLAFVRRGVAGAHRHLGCRERFADPFGGEADAGERRPQVFLDVERQRPQRRDVEDARAMGALVGLRGGDQPVDRGHERRQRLARPGRGADQGVFTGGDVRPTLHLGRGRFGKRRREPCPHRRRERPEHRMISNETNLPRGCHAPARDGHTRRGQAPSGNEHTETPVGSPEGA